jgi:hypothetical protein
VTRRAGSASSRWQLQPPSISKWSLKLKMQENYTLQDVVSKLEETFSTEDRGLLIAAEMLVSYFKMPAHEITVASVREGLRYFPLYLSWRGLPLDLIDNIIAEVGRLIRFGEAFLKAKGSATAMTGLPSRVPPDHDADSARSEVISLPGLTKAGSGQDAA